ncbi:hypothetical protein BC643_4388 [Mangrovibacterium diazotrophicum]|uniref:Uncharacterized protein n=1 Tax=Mangrovibacterium diazotrophicum TaxID=1261403 RepID=A0A419VVP8_9BACT|nr:hypothetical protein BC643_4388 [Mangrovibacterium diazotrophicum]
MKYLEFKYSGNKIEFENSVFGRETVKLNGRSVSRKYSVTGTSHIFKIGGDDFELKSTYKLFRDGALTLDLIKEESIVCSNSFGVNSRHRIAWMAIGFAIIYVVVRLMQ